MASMTKQELDERLKNDPVFKLAFQKELAIRVLQTLANCSDDSTIEGVRTLANEALKDLKQ
jgi:CRP-like cAMP-binding protein